jgi:acyl carrier protein
VLPGGYSGRYRPAATREEKAMTRRDDALFDDICALVRKFAPADAKLAPATELSADLNIDSVAAMDLIMEIEDRFAIDIPVNQLSDLRNLEDLVALVRNQLGGR